MMEGEDTKDEYLIFSFPTGFASDISAPGESPLSVLIAGIEKGRVS